MNDFTPQNTDTELYIYTGSYGNIDYSFALLMEMSQRHFGDDIEWGDLMISAENIHTRALTYDQFDPSDYDAYIVIRKV